MAKSHRVLSLWRRLSSRVGGKWLFSRLVCLNAPYFASIRPRFWRLEPGYCQVLMGKRRAVLNHLGTVHAIAMCNLAELAAGTMTEVTVPSTHRWIPKSMTVTYVKKAETDLVATAVPDSDADPSAAGEYNVNIEVRGRDAMLVCRVRICMWVSLKAQ